MDTPEAKKRSVATPPSGPTLLHRRLQNEIEAALVQGSVSLLSLALSRSHGCGEDHCVFEAVRCHHAGALELLLQRGPAQDVDRHCSGRRPLHLAVQTTLSEGDTGYAMAELLLRHSSRPGRCPGDSLALDAPLIAAAKRGCVPAVSLLLRYAGDPNSCDVYGSSLLHVVCRQAPYLCGPLHMEVVCLLLRYGACPCATDALGLTPAQYTLDVGLRQLLAAAGRCWNRRSLLLTLARSGGVSSAALLPEVVDAIVGCL